VRSTQHQIIATSDPNRSRVLETLTTRVFGKEAQQLSGKRIPNSETVIYNAAQPCHLFLLNL